MLTITQALEKVARQQNLSAEESHAVFREILEKEIPDAQVAAFLEGLRGKGESADEILGCARLLREKGIAVKTRQEFVVDTCGTGGDNAQTFNISTAAAFVAAGCGVAVAKHGNRSVSSRCGSADVLEALGIDPDIEPALAEKALNELGIVFLFAPRYHPVLKKVAALRRQLGIKTIFNIAGPLANPVRSKRSGQVVGVFEKRLVPVVAEALKNLGVEKALVVHSENGLDEISTSGKTELALLEKGKVALQKISPEELGIPQSELSQLRGGDAKENARIILDLLEGKKGAARDAVVLNAAAACVAGNKAVSLKEGVALAEQSLDKGLAKQKFLGLKSFIEKNRCVKV